MVLMGSGSLLLIILNFGILGQRAVQDMIVLVFQVFVKEREGVDPQWRCHVQLRCPRWTVGRESFAYVKSQGAIAENIVDSALDLKHVGIVCKLAKQGGEIWFEKTRYIVSGAAIAVHIKQGLIEGRHRDQSSAVKTDHRLAAGVVSTEFNRRRAAHRPTEGPNVPQVQAPFEERIALIPKRQFVHDELNVLHVLQDEYGICWIRETARVRIGIINDSPIWINRLPSSVVIDADDNVALARQILCFRCVLCPDAELAVRVNNDRETGFTEA